MPHALRADLVIEHVDNDVLVLDGQSSTVHRFTGSHAEAIKHLDAGENIEAFSTELADLDAAGLLETKIEGSAVSRRGVLLGGSALAGSAVLAMSMPGVASAQSPSSGEEIEVFGTSGIGFAFDAFTSSGNPIVRIASTSLSERFIEGDSWTLRILGFAAGSGPFQPISPTPSEEAAVFISGGNPRLIFDFDRDFAVGVASTDLEFEVQLERGNSRSEPFEVVFYDL